MKQGLNFKGFGLVILICLLCFFPTLVWAADRYVNINTGSNTTGDGTETKPWQTLHHAIPLLNDGDVLHVSEGEYILPTEPNEILIIEQSNVTIKGAGAELTIIAGEPSGNPTWNSGIIIAASNVTISDLGVRDFLCGDCFQRAGVQISSGTGNIIERCDLNDNFTGVWIESSSSGNIVRNGCWIFDNMGGIDIDGSSGNEIHGNEVFDNSWGFTGIVITNGAENNLIHDNNIYSLITDQDVGVAIGYAGPGNQVYQNDIHDHSDFGITVYESSPEIRKNRIYDNDVGIDVDGGTGIASPSISNNLIYDTSGSMSDGIYISASSGTAAPTIYHNTIDGGTSRGIAVAFVNSGTPVIKYNIVTSFGMYGIEDDSNYAAIDYNDVFGNTSGNYGGLTTPGLNDIQLNPLYASYELQAGSPCINAIPSGAGDTAIVDDLDGNPRPQGDGYDMGCYENPVSIPQSVPIPPGTDIEDYRMISFTVVPDDPGCVTVFGDEMGGIYDEDNFRIGAYDPTISEYVHCGDGLVIEPGRAYWILSRNEVEFTVNGIPMSLSDTEVELLYNATSGDGWNQIAYPNDADYAWNNVEVLEYDSEGCIVQGPTAISDLSDDNDMIDKRLWSWESGSYSDATTDMVQGNGYWVKAKKTNVFLKFRQDIQIELAQLSNSGIMFAGIFNKAKRWVKKWVFDSQVAIADSGDSPPMPMEALSGSSADSEGSDGGCFIATVAHGLP